MLQINVREIFHQNQRYPTVGDYYKLNDIWYFAISSMSDWRYVVLVLVHELIEWALCLHRGIKMEDIDAFDIQYEASRSEGDTSEPGDAPEAPYYKEHQFATHIEKLLAIQLNVEWEKYNEVVNNL